MNQQDLGNAVLDHVAIAVKNISTSKKLYEDLGFKFRGPEEVVQTQNVKTVFANIDNHAHLELLEPLSETGAIADFISKNGEGIHHIAFLVDDVGKKQDEMIKKGYRFIYEKPQLGANNKLINFIHPKSAGGVLIEISQERKP